MSDDFKTDILHWLEFDNKIISLSNEIKKLKEKKMIKEEEIANYIKDSNLTDKSIKIPSYNSFIKYTESQVYDNLSFRLLKESLEDCLSDASLIDKILSHTRNKRGRKTKVTLKRDAI
jgi:hypothetical protein